MVDHLAGAFTQPTCPHSAADCTNHVGGSGMFALLACMIAVVHVARHLQEFDKPMVCTLGTTRAAACDIQ